MKKWMLGVLGMIIMLGMTGCENDTQKETMKSEEQVVTESDTDIEMSDYYDENVKKADEKELIGTTPVDYDGAYGSKCFPTAVKEYKTRNGSYTEFILFIVTQRNNKGERPWVMFDTEDAYDHFEATFVCNEEMDENKVFHVEIYGDDEQLLESESINSYSQPLTIDLDITGYKMIKIVCVREDHNLSFATGQPSMAIVSAKLYN